jgi:hypothetical protein
MLNSAIMCLHRSIQNVTQNPKNLTYFSTVLPHGIHKHCFILQFRKDKGKEFKPRIVYNTHNTQTFQRNICPFYAKYEL